MGEIEKALDDIEVEVEKEVVQDEDYEEQVDKKYEETYKEANKDANFAKNPNNLTKDRDYFEFNFQPWDHPDNDDWAGFYNDAFSPDHAETISNRSITHY